MTKLPEKYRNSVLKQDVLKTLAALPDNSVDMIFGDPDYGVGIDYGGHTYKGVNKWEEYLDWYGALTTESMRVLSRRGNLFMMNYPRQNAYLRVHYLDAIAHDVHDYTWGYPTNVGHSPRRFTTAHRSILHATKSKDNKFYKDQCAQPYKNPTDPRIRDRIEKGHKGRMPYSWFEFNLVKNVARDKTLHACQIPVALYDMLLQASTKKGDSVFVLFGGSGSEVVHTKNAGRVYLSCEIHPDYHRLIQKRLKNGGAIPKGARLHDWMKEAKPNGISRTDALTNGTKKPRTTQLLDKKSNSLRKPSKRAEKPPLPKNPTSSSIHTPYRPR